jgi:hypothetical protein
MYFLRILLCYYRSSVVLFLCRHRKRRLNWLHWVHPIIKKKRKNSVSFTHYLVNYEMTQTGFFNYFEMSVSSFDEMHRRMKESVQSCSSKMKNCIQPVEMLAVAIG